ncbi:MAG: DNA-3-methyladenine glycosylase I [Halieaceae bacterium]
MPDFDTIYRTACERKGGAEALEQLLSRPVSRRKLAAIGDDRYLAEFTKKIFQSGFVWRVVEQKWNNFEELFWGFDVDKLLMMPDDMLERKAQDPAIIRNYRKVLTIRENAGMIAATRRQSGTSFGKFIADWPTDDVTGLWQYLKKHGSRLGGNTGPYALRSLGVDSFLLSRDVEGYLRLHGIIDSGIASKRALQSAQAFFNDLRQQSGRSLTEISRMISFNFGENRVGIDVH